MSGTTRTLVGVIGAGSADPELYELARALGAGLATAGLCVVNGGLGGVMEASARGAAEAGGLTVGILPGPRASDANRWIQVAVVTDMAHARNVVIANTARVVVAVGGSHGTRSEVSIALKLGRPVISLRSFDFDPAIRVVMTADEAVDAVLAALGAEA
ncbi:MAG: TIGR00725 family protein [Myxococcota bacterium]|nr:TIGR00725 family protein [Myxococcota bacterium]